jgi:hypothetical protein
MAIRQVLPSRREDARLPSPQGSPNQSASAGCEGLTEVAGRVRSGSGASSAEAADCPAPTPTPPRHLLGQIDALSVVSPRGQESQKPETLPRLALRPQPRRARGTHLRQAGHGRRPRCRRFPLAPPPPSSSACAPIYTPTTSRRRRVRGIQPDTSTMRATDNHHADRRASHVSGGPFDQRRRDGCGRPGTRSRISRAEIWLEVHSAARADGGDLVVVTISSFAPTWSTYPWMATRAGCQPSPTPRPPPGPPPTPDAASKNVLLSRIILRSGRRVSWRSRQTRGVGRGWSDAR